MRKRSVLVFTAAAWLIAVMCKKDTGVTIVNSWNLVNDSVNSSIGIAGQHSNYKGMNSDFFNFSANGKLYFKEGSVYDSCNYHLISNNEIVIEAFCLRDNGNYVPAAIALLTANNATIHITNKEMQNPGGTYERIINLNRH